MWQKFCSRQRSCPDKGFLQQRVTSGKVLPQAARLPRTSGLFKNTLICGEQICPRQRSCPRHVVSSNKIRFPRKKRLPQTAQLPRTSGLFRTNKSEFWKKFCPRQRGCPRQVTYSTKELFCGNSSALGSAAAPDRWLLQNKINFLETNSAPGSAAAPNR